MREEFPVLEVPSALSGDGLQQSEQMGSKQKFWHCDAQTAQWSLFKYSRPYTGEHWSEKVACELARALGLPHAQVELARHEGLIGVLVRDLRPDREHMALLHGNELLLEYDPDYPSQQGYRVSEHTVSRVARALIEHNVELPARQLWSRVRPKGVEDAVGLFIGYLLLDAIIGNTDRHHENWGVIALRDARGARVLQLAPTYDHASSLGRELPDEKRVSRLENVGMRGVEGYAERTRSAFYAEGDADKPLSPRAVFEASAALRPIAHRAWLARCAEVGVETLLAPLSSVPCQLASDSALAFARALIQYNIEALLSPDA